VPNLGTETPAKFNPPTAQAPLQNRKEPAPSAKFADKTGWSMEPLPHRDGGAKRRTSFSTACLVRQTDKPWKITGIEPAIFPVAKSSCKITRGPPLVARVTSEKSG